MRTVLCAGWDDLGPGTRARTPLADLGLMAEVREQKMAAVKNVGQPGAGQGKFPLP